MHGFTARIDTPEDVHGALKGQYERLETYASQMESDVVGFSQDLGSGLQFDRPGLQSALEAAKNGDFQILLVESVSRIGRDAVKVQEVNEVNYKVSLKLLNILLRNGIITTQEYEKSIF